MGKLNFFGPIIALIVNVKIVHMQVNPMKRLSGYLAIFKLLLGIYWLVIRQWLYLGYRRLFYRSGRRAMPVS